MLGQWSADNRHIRLGRCACNRSEYGRMMLDGAKLGGSVGSSVVVRGVVCVTNFLLQYCERNVG